MKSNKILVETELGMLTAEISADQEYPGIYISLIPNGKRHEVTLALAEVIKAENSPRDRAEFHIRPWCANWEGQLNVDGVRVEGRISHEAPMGDIVLGKEDFEKYCDVLG